VVGGATQTVPVWATPMSSSSCPSGFFASFAASMALDGSRPRENNAQDSSFQRFSRNASPERARR
jgi:hypothetical protein